MYRIVSSSLWFSHCPHSADCSPGTPNEARKSAIGAYVAILRQRQLDMRKRETQKWRPRPHPRTCIRVRYDNLKLQCRQPGSSCGHWKRRRESRRVRECSLSCSVCPFSTLLKCPSFAAFAVGKGCVKLRKVMIEAIVGSEVRRHDDPRVPKRLGWLAAIEFSKGHMKEPRSAAG